MSISNKDIKILYGRSAGQCNICKMNLLASAVNLGEMAHIIAKKSDGPRGIPHIPQSINDYNNLILLCSNHHTEVDKNPDAYTVSQLHEIKSAHEQLVSISLNYDSRKQADTESLLLLFQYIPFTSLYSYISELPNRLSTNAIFTEVFQNFHQSNPQSFPFHDSQLTHLCNLTMIAFDEIDDWMCGRLDGFNLIKMFSPNTSKGRVVNPYITDNCYSNYLVMNKQSLTHEQITFVHTEISKLQTIFITAYLNLLNYIKTNYPLVFL